MKLPEFNPQGSGPQGEGGIPPETIRQGLRDTGTDLIGANLKPEDKPEVQKVLEAEVNTLVQNLGIPAPSEPAQPPQAQPAETAAQPPQPAAAQPPHPPAERKSTDLEEKIQRVTEKFRGDFGELAKAHVHSQRSMTQAQQDRSSEMADLGRQMTNLNSQMAALLTPRTEPVNFEETLRQGSTKPEGMDAETFFKNPHEQIGKIVRDNLVAFKQAEHRVEAQRDYDRFQTEKAEEIERLRPVMAKLFVEDRDVYEGLPEKRVLEILLNRAKEREGYNRAAQFYAEIAGETGQPGAEGTPENPAPAIGSISTSPGASPRHLGTAAAPNGNWSKTSAVNRLWRTRDGGVDEMGALTDILRERGHGEHIK